MVRRLWGVNRMESSLRGRCGSGARALLLSGLFALAWLIWGAGTADAAPAGSGPGSGPVVLLHDDLLEPGPAARGAAALRGPADPRGTAALRGPADPRGTAALRGTADPRGTAAHGAAAPLESASAAVVAQPPKPVAAPEKAVASGPHASFTARSKEVSLPVALVPKVAVAAAGRAAVGFTEAATPLTTAAASAAQLIDHVADAVPGRPAVGLPSTPLTETTGRTDGQNPGRANSPAAAAPPREATAGVARGTTGPALTPAQLLVSVLAATTVREIQPADYLAPSAPPYAPPDTEHLLWLSALQGHSGSASAGTGGGGAEAAGEAGGFWNPWHAPRSARMPDAAHVPAATPSFDPGSSPD
jgi:hypothetical protein